jgi:hypothetical protein
MCIFVRQGDGRSAHYELKMLKNVQKQYKQFAETDGIDGVLP